MITGSRAAAGAHPSEELRIQSQLHREPKGEIVHCGTGEAFSMTALLAAFSTPSARSSSLLLRSSCAGRAAFCDCSDRTAGPRNASAAASTSVRRRMVFTGRAHGWRSPTLASGGCRVTVCSFMDVRMDTGRKWPTAFRHPQHSRRCAVALPSRLW
jgi:hypothetical protein